MLSLKEQYHVNLQKDECHTDSQGKSLLDFLTQVYDLGGVDDGAKSDLVGS